MNQVYGIQMPPVKYLNRSPVNCRPRSYNPVVRRNATPPIDITTTSYFIGKGIILFTMFYTSMNWMYYRGIRKEIERDEKDRKN